MCLNHEFDSYKGESKIVVGTSNNLFRTNKLSYKQKFVYDEIVLTGDSNTWTKFIV